MGKLPAIQFYPGDEFRSNSFGLSMAARGLWFYMRLLMHDSERRGYLSMNGKPIPPRSIAQKCGCTPEQYLTLLGELDSASIPSRTTDGVIYDKAIVEQEKERQATAKRVRDYRAKLSNASCNASVTENVRPSSSSLSSSNINNKNKKPNFLKEDFEVTEEMRSWAASKGIPDVASRTEAFRDYHTAKGSKFLDWTAAWRTWMRNSIKFEEENGKAKSKSKNSTLEAFEKYRKKRDGAQDNKALSESIRSGDGGVGGDDPEPDEIGGAIWSDASVTE